MVRISSTVKVIFAYVSIYNTGNNTFKVTGVKQKKFITPTIGALHMGAGGEELTIDCAPVEIPIMMGEMSFQSIAVNDDLVGIPEDME